MTKDQVADFFEVSNRTKESYLAQNEAELKKNGYEVLMGKSLKDLKLAILDSDGTEIYFGTIKKTSKLAIFDFRAFLTLGNIDKGLKKRFFRLL